MEQFSFNTTIDEIAKIISDATDNTNSNSYKNRILQSLEEIRSTAAEMDTQLEFLRKQSSSVRLTGFANWGDIVAESNAEIDAHRVVDEQKFDTGSAVVVKKKEKAKVTFPEFKYPSNTSPRSKIRVGSILDTFSEKAFAYEWENVPLTRSDWKNELIGCELLFVESAWAGNSNEWRYCLTGKSAPRDEVIKLVEHAKEQNIPTIFWNKEDPPHFADFLRTAALFDVVLTTDESCVEKYKEELGHERIGVLPFAAQPAIHNPSRPYGVMRDKSVAFGGMYFAHKYPERKEQMEYLLPAAAKFDFDIFSRQLGGDPNYQFPEPFDENVVGSLSYDQMLTAYHAYKIFLNVNSVTTSSTMCARRIFEILASGGSVVSAPSPAIERYFPDGLVPMPETEEEAYHDIRALLRPGGYRDKMVHKAQRRIWGAHTFSHRVDSIFTWAGLKMTRTKPTVSVIAPTIRPAFVSHILASVARQKDVEVELNLLLHGFDVNRDELRKQAQAFGIENINILHAEKNTSLGENLNRLVSAASGEVVSKMDDDDFYGEYYLHDLLNAKMYSKAEIVGKASSYIHFESKNATILSYGASENKFGKFVRGATLTADRDLFLEVPFENLNRSEDTTFIRRVTAMRGKVYAADRFNFWIRRSSDPSHHTWSIADQELFATGPVVNFGDPTEFVGA